MIVSNPIVNEKVALRQRLLATRLNLSEAERLNWDQRIFDALVTLPVFTTAQHIACFVSHLNEPNLVPKLLDYLQNARDNAQTRSLYLPILKKSAAGSYLTFGLCDAKTEYKNNLYGIPEPVVTPEFELKADELDVILMPLVGFNAKRKRIGMGGGFYDRTLSFKVTHPVGKPHLVGIAYACQKSDSLPIENHDVTLDCVVTENQIY